MANTKKENSQIAREQQQRQAASDAAKQAAARHNEPADIRDRALMQRQGKNMHQKDGR